MMPLVMPLTFTEYMYSDDFSDEPWAIWEAACIWQREQDAIICERADVDYQDMTPTKAALKCATLIRENK